MSAITTHVLDTMRGRPAADVSVVLERRDTHGWIAVGRSATDADGRCRTLLPPSVALSEGVYRLTFDTGGYFGALNVDFFYPEVQIVFEVDNATEHYHVPLLIAPHGYTTYRGS